MYKVALFTSSYRVVEKLSHIFDVEVVFCEEKTYNLMLFNYCRWQSIPLLKISTESDIIDILPLDIEIGISFGFGIIFKESTIATFPKGIWNIHTGTLPQYRGRHPITWAFIKGDNKIGVTVHQVDSSIDQGRLLACDYIYRDINDGADEISNKVIDLLSGNLMQVAIDNYEKDHRPVIKDGEYLKPFLSGISIQSTLDVDSDFLFNAVRAQRIYGGVRINGVLYKDAYYYASEFHDLLKDGEIVECNDGIKLALFKEKITI